MKNKLIITISHTQIIQIGLFLTIVLLPWNTIVDARSIEWSGPLATIECMSSECRSRESDFNGPGFEGQIFGGVSKNVDLQVGVSSRILSENDVIGVGSTIEVRDISAPAVGWYTWSPLGTWDNYPMDGNEYSTWLNGRVNHRGTIIENTGGITLVSSDPGIISCTPSSCEVVAEGSVTITAIIPDDYITLRIKAGRGNQLERPEKTRDITIPSFINLSWNITVTDFNEPPIVTITQVLETATYTARALWLYEDVENDEQARYQIQVSRVPADFNNLSNLVYNRTITSSRQRAHTVNPIVPHGDYYVRIRASDSYDPNRFGQWSTPVSFIITEPLFSVVCQPNLRSVRDGEELDLQIEVNGAITPYDLLLDIDQGEDARISALGISDSTYLFEGISYIGQPIGLKRITVTVTDSVGSQQVVLCPRVTNLGRLEFIEAQP